jgi:hypothetical protein
MKNNSRPQIIVAFLIIATIVAACNPSASTPTIQISSARMQVCVGETVALVTNAKGTDLTYRWSVTGNGQLKNTTEEKGDAGSSNRYTAPTAAGENVVKVTVTDANNQRASNQVVIKVVACPTPTPTPEPPTPTPTPAPPTLLITSPKTGDVVTMTIPVTGTVAIAFMTDGTGLYVLVRPHQLNDQDPLFDYWGQPQPNINSDGTWEAKDVGVGTEKDPGRSFDICAVLTSRTITSTNYSALPSGPASCNTVTRK